MRIAFYTLGCKVNQYDTQSMRECFAAAGYDCVPFGEETDALLINTCTVTNTGDRKSLRMIRRMGAEGKLLIVAGCLAQRMGEALTLPGVRLILGNARRREVVSLFEKALREGGTLCAVEALGAGYEDMDVCTLEGRTRAVMKIQEGCDNFCSFCIIPSVRGGVRSKPLDSIRREAERIVGAGYKEIVLTGIHLMSYGRGEGLHIADAARAVAEAGVPRIRLGSLEPPLSEDVLSQLAEIEPICPHFHISLQSGSDGILRAMKRRYNTAQYARMLALLRERFPGCAVTTDIICGFPGETEEDFQRSLDFAQESSFAKVHAFPFSPREGTPAAAMKNALPRTLVKERNEKMVALSSVLEERYARSLVGSCAEVLCERAEDGVAEGFDRRYMRVAFPGGLPGEIFSVTIDAYDDAGLTGIPR